MMDKTEKLMLDRAILLNTIKSIRKSLANAGGFELTVDLIDSRLELI